MSIPRVLVADDQADVLHALRLLLVEAGCEADLVNSADAVIERVAGTAYDLLLLDLNYTRDTTSGREGLDLLADVHGRDETLPIVVMTGWGAIDTAVEAMRRGAKSFVQKPWDNETLVGVIQREIADGRASRSRDARLVREHEDARAIQRTLLPTVLPTIGGCTFAASWTPAAELGGDCYDILRVSETRVAISIADIIGKGLPAALLMANFQASVRAFATADALPHDVCASVNRLLCGAVAPGKFVTGCYALLDTRDGALTYANAGHNAPVVLHRDGRVERLMPTGRVFGVTIDSTYTTGVIQTEPGDRVVFFTDGITEALAPDGVEFGEDRLLDVLGRHSASSADDLARTLADTVTAWASGTPRDDATIIVAAIG